MIFLAFSLTYSLPSVTFFLLLHLSSGFKKLNSSLAPRSKWPLPFICQPFDVVPVWAACYAMPLTARPEVRGGLYFRTQPHLNSHPLPTPSQMCLSLVPTRSPSPAPSLPQCPLLFYSLVLHSFLSGCGERQTFGFIAYTCPRLSPSAGRDKTTRPRWPMGASHLNSPHLELIAGGQDTSLPQPRASGVSICRDINRC